MIVSRTTGTQPLLLFAAIAAAGLAVIVAGIYFFPLTIDEAYITYSHARNFARSGRLVHHPSNPEFSVSTPLYALLLGLGGAAGLPIAALSKLLGAASIFGSSVYLLLLCYRHRMIWAALTSGLLLATSPLLWLTLGLETSFFLLLVLAALYHLDRGHYVAAALLAACAVLSRAEGVLFAGVLVFYHFSLIARRRELSYQALTTSFAESAVALLFTWKAFGHFARGEYLGAAVAGLVAGVSILLFFAVLFRRGGDSPANGSVPLSQPAGVRPSVPWKALAALLIVLAPASLYLSLTLGLPPKTALLTQQGWAAIGFTGFGVGTSFLEGLRILFEGWVDQSGWYFLWMLLPIVGMRGLLSSPFTWAVYLWGGVYLVGAAWFDLPPSSWSYSALVPVVALLLGLALQRLAESSLEWDTLRYYLDDATRPFLVAVFVVLFLILMWPQAVSLRAMAAALRTEETPPAAQAKVAPTGSGTSVFREVGAWLNANTPPDATVAANNVGIIGYYADRAMIDFLGRLQPEVAQALQRRDLFYAIPHLLPDYIVLGEERIIFDIWLHGDPWFEAHYQPVKRFTSDRHEQLGSRPVVVFRRVLDPPPMVERETKLNRFPYDGLTLSGLAMDRERPRPGDWMRVRLDVHVKRFYDSSVTWMINDPVLNISAYLTNADGEVVTGRANSGVLTTFHTEHWAEDGVSPIYAAVHVPEGLTPGAYDLWVRAEKDDREGGTRRLTSLTVNND